MNSAPAPTVQPTRVSVAVEVVSRFDPAPAGPEHQPTPNAVPQNALALTSVNATPPVANSRARGVTSTPPRRRRLPSQVCFTVAVSRPGAPTTAGLKVPGIPLMVLLFSP